MRLSRFYFLLLLPLLLVSCAVPDVQPFADATSDMGKAIDSSLRQVSSDFKRLSLLAPQDLTAAEHDTLRQLQRQLAAATRAFGAVPPALDEYAAALVAIAGARVKDNARIDAVTSAIGKLAVAAGPWGRAVGLAAEPTGGILKDLNDKKALNSLSNKVTAQDSAIQRIARYLAQGLHRFSSLDTQAVAVYQNNLAGQYVLVRKYYGARLAIQAQAIKVLQNLAELEAFRLRLALPDRAAGAEADLASAADQLTRLDPELARHYPRHPPLTAPETRAARTYYQFLDTRAAYYKSRLIDPQTQALYQDAEQHLAAYYTEQQRNQLLLGRCAGLIMAWAQSHRALHISLSQARHQLVARQLVDQAQAIKKAADDIRALKPQVAN